MDKNDGGQEVEVAADRADVTVQAMRNLRKKSRDLRAEIFGAIDLI